MVLGVQGKHVLYSGYQRPLKHLQDVTIENKEYRWLKPATNLALKDNWTLYDLRKLRLGKAANLSPDWKRVVYGYDLLIVIPELTPADLIQ